MTPTNLDLIPLQDLVDAIKRRCVVYCIAVKQDNNIGGMVKTWWSDDIDEFMLLGLCETLKKDISDHARAADSD